MKVHPVTENVQTEDGMIRNTLPTEPAALDDEEEDVNVVKDVAHSEADSSRVLQRQSTGGSGLGKLSWTGVDCHCCCLYLDKDHLKENCQKPICGMLCCPVYFFGSAYLAWTGENSKGYSETTKCKKFLGFFRCCCCGKSGCRVRFRRKIPCGCIKDIKHGYKDCAKYYKRDNCLGFMY